MSLCIVTVYAADRDKQARDVAGKELEAEIGPVVRKRSAGVVCVGMSNAWAAAVGSSTNPQADGQKPAGEPLYYR